MMDNTLSTWLHTMGLRETYFIMYYSEMNVGEGSLPYSLEVDVFKSYLDGWVK